MGTAIREVRSRFVFSGHLRIEKPYTVYKFDCGTLCIRIDSSQKHKTYLIVEGSKLAVWKDFSQTGLLVLI